MQPNKTTGNSSARKFLAFLILAGNIALYITSAILTVMVYNEPVSLGTGPAIFVLVVGNIANALLGVAGWLILQRINLTILVLQLVSAFVSTAILFFICAGGY